MGCRRERFTRRVGLRIVARINIVYEKIIM